MGKLTIKDETVYVVYRNGEPYSTKGIKVVYTTKGSASGIITTESKRLAEESVWTKPRDYRSWMNLSSEKKDEIIDRIRSEFEVVEYKRSK